MLPTSFVRPVDHDWFPVSCVRYNLSNQVVIFFHGKIKLLLSIRWETIHIVSEIEQDIINKLEYSRFSSSFVKSYLTTSKLGVCLTSLLERSTNFS